MQITIDEHDLEPIIVRAIDRALERFAAELKEKLTANGQPGLRTTKQAAEFCGVCEKTITNRVGSGDLVATRIGGNVRFTQLDLDAFVERSRTVTSK
jgi:excisionase family DNA binding protein